MSAFNECMSASRDHLIFEFFKLVVKKNIIFTKIMLDNLFDKLSDNIQIIYLSIIGKFQMRPFLSNHLDLAVATTTFVTFCRNSLS